MSALSSGLSSTHSPASLRRTAHRLSRFASFLAWAIPLAILAQYLIVDPALLPVPSGMGGTLDHVKWDTVQRLLGAAVALLPVGGIVAALLAVGRICREYSAGGLFSNAVLAAYRHLASALAVTTLLHWLHPTLLNLALALTLPPGQRFLTVGASAEDFLLLLVTGVVFMLGAVMRVAQQLQTENAEIV